MARILFFLLVLSCTNAWAISGDPVLTIRQDNTGTFTVSVRAASQETAVLVVFDATGKYVYLKTLRASDGEFGDVVDLGRFPKGIYVFEVESDSFRAAKKIVMQ
jgi:hypothetical protein